MAHRLKPLFFRTNYLGTDEQGRDMLSRLLYGGRTSLVMGILPVIVATVIGGLFGVVAGYAGGRLGMLIMRGMDVFFAFPSVLLAVAISGSLGGGMINQLITLTVVLTPPLCRVAETATSQIRSMDFVDAARATRRLDNVDPVPPHPGQCGLAGAGLCVHLGFRFDPAGVRSVVPRAGRIAADTGLGFDAVNTSTGNLRAARGVRHAGRRHPDHLGRIQPGQ